MGDVCAGLWWQAWPPHPMCLRDGVSSLIPLCNTSSQSISEKRAKTWQMKHLKENSGSGVRIPKNSLSIFYSAFFCAQCTDRKDWGEGGGELGNSFSSTVSSAEARPWCKTSRCLRQATGSEDSQGELSLFTSGKNGCCAGPLTFSALWILPSAFLTRGPCASEGAGPSLRAVLRAGLGEARFPNWGLLCWVRRCFNPCVL